MYLKNYENRKIQFTVAILVDILLSVATARRGLAIGALMATTDLVPTTVACWGQTGPVLLPRSLPLHGGSEEGGGGGTEVVCDVTIVPCFRLVAQATAHHGRSLHAGCVASLKYYHLKLKSSLSAFLYNLIFILKLR